MFELPASSRSRLDLLSWACVAGLAVPPLALGYAVLGWEMAWLLLGVSVITGLVRTGGNVSLPGTYALAPFQAPGLFALVESLARRAGLARLPEIRIVPGGQVNAAAMLTGNRPVLVVTEALLDRLDARRLGAVLAHETAHLAHRDLVVFRLANALQAASVVLGTATVILAVLSVTFDPANAVFWALVAAVSPLASRFLIALLSRTREFAADLRAARLTGDPLALADALAIIEYRPRTWWDWLAGRRSPLPLDPAGNAFRTHPPTPERIARLVRLTKETARESLFL